VIIHFIKAIKKNFSHQENQLTFVRSSFVKCLDGCGTVESRCVWHSVDVTWLLNIMRTTYNCIYLEEKDSLLSQQILFEGRSLILIEQIITVYLWKVPFIRRPLHLFLLFQTFLLVVGMVVVMVAAIPWIAIPVIPLGIIFFVLRWYFLRTSRDVKRLECTSEYRDSQVGMAMQAGFHLCNN